MISLELKRNIIHNKGKESLKSEYKKMRMNMKCKIYGKGDSAAELLTSLNVAGCRLWVWRLESVNVKLHSRYTFLLFVSILTTPQTYGNNPFVRMILTQKFICYLIICSACHLPHLQLPSNQFRSLPPASSDITLLGVPQSVPPAPSLLLGCGGAVNTDGSI